MRSFKLWLGVLGALGLAALAAGAYFIFAMPERAVRAALDYEHARSLEGRDAGLASPEQAPT